MTDKFTPIRLRGLRSEEVHEIDSCTSAIGFMYSLWPRKTGEKRASAEQACRQALAGDITPDEARLAFYEAALEADILDQPKD